jgi:hypothetical protein
MIFYLENFRRHLHGEQANQQLTSRPDVCASPVVCLWKLHVLPVRQVMDRPFFQSGTFIPPTDVVWRDVKCLIGEEGTRRRPL